MTKTCHVVLIFPDGHEAALEVPDTMFVLDAAMEAGLSLPYTCLQGWCITCAGRVLNAAASECVDNRAALRYYLADAEAGFVLLCTGRALRDCRISVYQTAAMKVHRRQHHLPAPQG
ncbi:MAG: 2Fe-2S iron-sulfur cluster-binding protein [Chloroflexota bacterium]